MLNSLEGIYTIFENNETIKKTLPKQKSIEVLEHSEQVTHCTGYRLHFPCGICLQGRGNSNGGNYTAPCSCPTCPSQSSQYPPKLRSFSLSHAVAVGSSGCQPRPAWPQNLRAVHFWATIVAVYFFMCLPFTLCFSVPFYGISNAFSYATLVLCL